MSAEDRMMVGYNDENPMVEVQLYGQRFVAIDVTAENKAKVMDVARRISLSVNTMVGISTDDIAKNPLLVAVQQGIMACANDQFDHTPKGRVLAAEYMAKMLKNFE